MPWARGRGLLLRPPPTTPRSCRASLWVLDGGPPFVTRVALEGSEAKALGEEEQFPSHHQTPHIEVGAVRRC
jgi:hypothetical protein